MLEGFQEGTGSQHQEQRQQCVRVVEAEDQYRGRGERRTAPAMVAAAVPNERRTMANRTTTVAMPHSASGSRMLHELRPKTRTERPMSMVLNGGLSTVMKFAASKEPKNQADQLCEAASAAAQ